MRALLLLLLIAASPCFGWGTDNWGSDAVIVEDDGEVQPQPKQDEQLVDDEDEDEAEDEQD